MNYSMLFLILACVNIAYQLGKIALGFDPTWSMCFDATYFQAYAIWVCWYTRKMGFLK